MRTISNWICGFLFFSVLWWVSYGTFRPTGYLIEPAKCGNAVHSEARPLTVARLTRTMYRNSFLAFWTDITGPPACLCIILLSARLPLGITCFLTAVVFTFYRILPVVSVVWFVCSHLWIQHGGGGLGYVWVQKLWKASEKRPTNTKTVKVSLLR